MVSVVRFTIVMSIVTVARIIQGDAGVVPYGSGDGGSDSYENVVALLLPQTGSDQPVNCVLGAAYPGIPMRRTTQLINSVVRAPGDKDGTPRTGFAEPVNGVVRASGPEGPGCPGNEYSLTQTGSYDLIYSVVRVSGLNGSGGSCDEESSPRTGSDTPLHCDVHIVKMYQEEPVGLALGTVTFLRVLLQNIPGMRLLCQ